MTQARSFLLIAWLLVGFLIWDAWQKDYAAAPVAAEPATDLPPLPDAAATADVPAAPDTVPTLDRAPDARRSAAPDAVLAGIPTEQAEAGRVVVTTDLLRLVIDSRGATVVSAELLAYRKTPEDGSAPVELLSTEPQNLFVAQSGFIAGDASAPTHEATFVSEREDYALAAGSDTLEVPLVWRDDQGREVHKLFVFERGSYVVEMRETLHNGTDGRWQVNPYRQLMRVEPPSRGNGFTNPEAYSFVGAAWYSPQDKFDKEKFTNFEPGEYLDATVSGGWVAMLQHYFFAAWIPDPLEPQRFTTSEARGRYLISSVGPGIEVASGSSETTTARLYVGPKLQEQLDAIAPGLRLTLDYGIFTILAQPLAWTLDKLHSITGNWGWAIVLLVLIIKLLLFKLSEAQYRSFARMRAVQPRIESLKERYGDDRQKFQQAMMELYKKEKINPMGGCLPILVQIPIFISLYWVLLESVELRHAPWILWIDNLTAPDPYFILPILNLLTMWATQKLSPSPGMDPMQKRIMQIMPIAFGVIFAFFPAGLVLYWTTNGALGLLQQWVITRRHAPKVPAKA